MIKNLLMIIPAFNESKKISNVIMNLKSEGFKNILVVDDGSTDGTAQRAQRAGAKTIQHAVNIGLGGALSTGFKYAGKNNFDYMITFDADGQHLAKDAAKIAMEMKISDFDLVIGSRMLELKKKHKVRYTINLLASLITRLIYNVKVLDTQSGLRGFNKKAIEKMKVNSTGYEVSSEILIIAAKQNLKIKEIPISAVYSEYSLQKGQKISNAINVLTRLFLNTK